MRWWSPWPRETWTPPWRGRCKQPRRHGSQARTAAPLTRPHAPSHPPPLFLPPAAAAAPGSIRGALASCALAPASVALALAVAVFCADATLPPALAQLTAHLAAAHRPLTLLALGAALLDGWPETTSSTAAAAPVPTRPRALTAALRLPPPPQLRAVIATLALKYVTSLLVVAAATAALPSEAPRAAIACALLLPVSPLVAHFAAAHRNAAAGAAPLVCASSAVVSAVCAVSLVTASALQPRWGLPAAALLLAAACVSTAAVAARALAPQRMKLNRDAFIATQSAATASTVPRRSVRSAERSAPTAPALRSAWLGGGCTTMFRPRVRVAVETQRLRARLASKPSAPQPLRRRAGAACMRCMAPSSLAMLS